MLRPQTFLQLLIITLFSIMLQITATESSLLADHQNSRTYGALHKVASATIDDNTYTRVVKVLRQDYEENVVEMVKSRKCLRTVTSITKMLGNTFLYIGSGLSTVAAAANVLNSQELVSAMLFASTACCAAHITLIGVSKWSSREEKRRDEQLVSLGEQVGFKVIPLSTSVSDMADDIISTGIIAKCGSKEEKERDTDEQAALLNSGVPDRADDAKTAIVSEPKK